MEKNIMTGCPCCHSTSLAKISPKTSKVPEDFLYFKNFRSYKHQCLVFLKTNNIKRGCIQWQIKRGMELICISHQYTPIFGPWKILPVISFLIY